MIKKVLPEAMQTGITFIDEEHAALVQICADLLNAAAKNSDLCRIKELLNFLMRYTETHFLNEEQLMREYGYSQYDFHVEEHDYFRQFVKDSLGSIETTEAVDESVTEMLEAVNDWIVEHINKIDLDMSADIYKK